MTGGWAATNTLRDCVRDIAALPRESRWHSLTDDDPVAALALVEAALDAAERVDRIYEGLRTDENDGEFALWSEDDLVAALHDLRPALRAVREGA